MDVLYAVKKEGTFSPSADSYFTAPTSQGDAARDSLRKANALRRASSYKINIGDFLQAVNSTAAGNAVLPLDVLRRLRMGRGNAPRRDALPRWQGLAVEKRAGIAYNGERKRAPCGGRGGPRGGVRGEMDACCKNRSNGWF